MGISIYYCAERKHPLTKAEQAKVSGIAERHDAEKTFDDGEDFCVYDPDLDEPETIFSGSTQLPMSGALSTVEACIYWARCLTEIRRAVPGAEWHVHLDDDDLEWNAENGWYLPDME